MNIEQLREYALNLPDVEETTPFGPDVLVYKTSNKMFMLLPLDSETLRFNVKCDPEWAIQLREEYPNRVLPGYHMNKIHWNTIIVNGELSQMQLMEHIDNSYKLISASKRKSKN